MAVKKAIALYGGRLKELQSGDTLDGASSGGVLPIVTTDPVAPANGEAWILQSSVNAGMAMGTLGTTYASTVLLDDYKFKVKTADGNKYINLL